MAKSRRKCTASFSGVHENRTIAAFRLPLWVTLFLVCLIGGCHEWNEVIDDGADDARASIQARRAILLLSEVGDAREQGFDGFELVNDRPTTANLSLTAKSCACLRMEGLPASLAPGEHCFPKMLISTLPRPSDETQIATGRLTWSDESYREFTIQQRVQIVRDASVSPSVVEIAPLGADSGTPGNSKNARVAFLVRYRSRDDRHIDAQSVEFLDVPAGVEIRLDGVPANKVVYADVVESNLSLVISADRLPNGAAGEPRSSHRLRCRANFADGSWAEAPFFLRVRTASAK